jgi:hypothetical protein
MTWVISALWRLCENTLTGFDKVKFLRLIVNFKSSPPCHTAFWCEREGTWEGPNRQTCEFDLEFKFFKPTFFEFNFHLASLIGAGG